MNNNDRPALDISSLSNRRLKGVIRTTLRKTETLQVELTQAEERSVGGEYDEMIIQELKERLESKQRKLRYLLAEQAERAIFK